MVMKTPLPRVSRRGRVAVAVVVALIVAYTLLSWVAQVWTDWLWYDEVGYTQVFSTQFQTRLLLFALFGGVMGLWLAGHLYLAFRLRPVLRPNSPEQLNLDRYRVRVTPRIGLYITLAAGFIGLITGLSAQGRWQQWLLFWNAGEFGREDPQFGLDVGYYVFEYPFWRFLLGIAFTAVVVGVLGALFVHYLYGGVRLQGAGDRMTTAARAHLSALVGLFVILKAVAYFLDRYGLLLGHNAGLEDLAGAGYADINALLPAKEILVWITVIAAVAVIVFANAVVRNLVWPGVALALVAVSAIAIGGVYPWSVQTFEVRPNLRDKEAPYIDRTIKATRYAYGIEDSLVRETYPVSNTTPPSDLDKNAAARDSVRLLDPSVVSDTYSRLQQVRSFYDFNDTLDVDRYTQPDGSVKDYVVGVRELEPRDLAGNQLSWQNRHTRFTHGYGLVAAPANDPCGTRPRFVSGFLGDPDAGDSEAAECAVRSPLFNVDRPQIYYGELVSDYSIVGKAPGGTDREFDRPAATGGASEGISNTYDGKGGVPVDTLSRRMLYTLRYGWEWNFMLSDVLNENSKILYVRNPRDRVEKAAPFLTVDGDPYPAVVDGRVVWIVDAYTTASTYPYSEDVNLEEAATDALTGAGSAQQARRNINYIRNSVKAVVDAYDGSVSLYEWDTKDPVLKAWNRVFDGLVKPKSQIPSDLSDHFRYPEDMFKVQRDMLARFHVSDPHEFFSADDFWEVPKDPKNPDSGDTQPPYYLLANLSDKHQGEATFQLTSAMNAAKRPNLSALISGYYDGDQPKLLVLELPVDAVDGPTNVQQQLVSFGAKDISDFQRSQDVVYGNLLTLPVGGGLLYAEPLYLKSKQQEGAYPTLQRVLLSYGTCVAFERTLNEGLAALAERRNCSGETSPGEEPGEPPPTGAPPDTSDPEVAKAVENLKKAIANLRKAQQSGDFEAYGKALEELEKAVEEFERVTGGKAPVKSPPASPSPRGSPTSSPAAD